MLRRFTPKDVAPPLANYAHATEVPPGARWLVLSGQLGIAKDGTIPPGAAAQADLCFRSIGSILKEAAMDFADIVTISAFLIDESDLADYMAVRDRYVTDSPSSTLIVVKSFSKKQFRVEIETIAAKLDTSG